MSVARRCFAAWRGLVAKRAALEHRGAWLRQRALLSQPLWRWHAHAQANAAVRAKLAPAVRGILSCRMARGWRTWAAVYFVWSGRTWRVGHSRPSSPRVDSST